ncbi:MAG: ferredoxin:thioredoxin reductase [Candidatus Lokiarchaeota archaeon]|nr:ferredoxin:thioredoxin reductase [Candidatus Lokiarchaeota archaeon]
MRNREDIEKIAEIKGWKVNPDDEVVELIIKGLNKNKEKHGFYYCPCRVVSGDKEEDKNKICPCIWAQDEIDDQGICHCRLYVSKDYKK